MDDSQYLAAIAAILLFAFVEYVQARRREVKVPTIGPSGVVTSYIGGFRWLTRARSIVHEGYVKHKNGAFKVAQLDKWHVIVTGRTLTDELLRAPDDKLSFQEAVRQTLGIDYTVGPAIHDNMYHAPIVRSQLTRNLGVLFQDIVDEISEAFNEHIPPTDEWVGHTALSTSMQVVCRATNRVFVGLPLCRDPDYIKLNIDFTVQVVKASVIIKLAPKFLRPLVGSLATAVPSSIRQAVKHLQPIIEERHRRYAESGKEYPDKPNDMLSWLMDEAQGEEMTIDSLTRRILTVNLASVHTSSLGFADALLHLASKPQYIPPLREEIESIIKQEGWTKTSMGKMRKLDSFFRESQRFSSMSTVIMTRKALQDFTFSDGTFIPKGTIVSAAAAAAHHDAENYERPDEFDPFRFVHGGTADSAEHTQQLVSTGLDFLPFGHGRHACPGRFFVANEFKAMMAHVLLTYDIKMEQDGVRPPDLHFAESCIPDPKARVLFRRRRQQV